MRYEKQMFKGETIELDGNQFIDCSFKDCTLTLDGSAPFEMTPMAFSGVSIQVRGAAKAGAEMQRFLYAQAVSAVPEGSAVQIGGKWFRRTANAEAAA